MHTNPDERARLRPWLCPLRTALLWTGLLICLGAIPEARAVDPTVVSHGLYADFSRGEADGTALSSEGAVALAPPVEEWAALEVERIWALAAGPDGEVYAGTGDEGRLYRIDGDGAAQLLFDSPEVAICALTADGDGTLYVGTSPDGLIYRLRPGGQAQTYARTGAHYVWSLSFDHGGRLLAGTGEPARVLRLDGGDEPEVLLDAGDRHVMSLARRGQTLYAATAGAATAGTGDVAPRGGRIYEIGPDGDGRLLVETEYREVSHLALSGDGALYASAVSAVSGEDGAARAALLRLDASGAVASLWEIDAMALDLALDGRGRPVVALSEPGRLYRLAPDGQSFELLRQFEEFTPHRLLADAGGIAIGGGHSGRLLRMGSGVARRGHYDGPVADFGAHARWGALQWRVSPVGAPLQVRTRSGNSPEPDDTWSSWSEPLEHPGATAPSPPARYLQYRVAMEAADGISPRLEQVAVAGEQFNLAPEIGEFTTYPYRPGQKKANGAPETTAPPSRGGASLPQRKSLRLVRWQAADPNGDDLVYDIYLRGEGQTTWKLAEEGTEKTTIVWDTENMPEGMTQLRLVASDRPDNAAAQALTDTWTGDAFAIDNSPPRISVQVAGRDPLRLEIDMEDAVTPVRGARYTVDYDDRKHQIEPDDGIYDRRRERARIALEDLGPGEHVITVQAWDELENVGASQVIVKVD